MFFCLLAIQTTHSTCDCMLVPLDTIYITSIVSWAYVSTQTWKFAVHGWLCPIHVRLLWPLTGSFYSCTGSSIFFFLFLSFRITFLGFWALRSIYFFHFPSALSFPAFIPDISSGFERTIHVQTQTIHVQAHAHSWIDTKSFGSHCIHEWIIPIHECTWLYISVRLY